MILSQEEYDKNHYKQVPNQQIHFEDHMNTRK